jgi:hypothetical protein
LGALVLFIQSSIAILTDDAQHESFSPHIFRHVLATFAMILIAACGTDSGFAERSPEATRAPPDKPTASSTAMPKDLRAAYIASVQRNAPEAYTVHVADTVVRMENPAQKFVATVDGQGLSLMPDEDAWSFALRTVSMGCAGAMVSVADGLPDAHDNRVEVCRGGLEEWYLNGPLGVEQGFVVNEAPACTGVKRISLAIDGDLAANLDDADGDGRRESVRFVDANGKEMLSYGDLFVTDATGKTVPAWLTADAGDVAIVVDDAGAVYPLAIDPLVWGQQQKLTASDGAANDRLEGVYQEIAAVSHLTP